MSVKISGGRPDYLSLLGICSKNDKQQARAQDAAVYEKSTSDAVLNGLDYISELQQKYSNSKFSVGNASYGKTYGKSTNINFVVDPKYLEKLGTDKKSRTEFVKAVDYLYSYSKQFETMQKASGREVVSQGWFCDENGNWGGWTVTRTDKKSEQQKEKEIKQKLLKKKKALKAAKKKAAEKAKTEKARIEKLNSKKRHKKRILKKRKALKEACKKAAEKVKTEKARTEKLNYEKYNDYLKNKYDCLKKGKVRISEKYMRECVKDPDKAAGLEQKISDLNKTFEHGSANSTENTIYLLGKSVYCSRVYCIGGGGVVTVETYMKFSANNAEAAEKVRAEKEKKENEEKSAGGTVTFNESKRAGQVAAAKTRGDLRIVIGLLSRDLSECRSGAEKGWCDKSEAAKVEAMIRKAIARMSQLSDDETYDGGGSFRLNTLI